MMRTTFAILSLILAVSISLNAEAQSVQGNWQAVAVKQGVGKVQRLPPNLKIIFNFLKDGKLKTVTSDGKKTDTKAGTWAQKGTMLTMVIGGKTEKGTALHRGGALMLITYNPKVRGNETIYLKPLK